MEIRRGIIRAFDSGTYLADVQIVGSMATTLAGVPVAKQIGADLLTSGTKCGVLFFDETNPSDACVVFVYDGVPIPWITSTLIKDGEVAVGDLAFDPATQAELDAHAAQTSVHHAELTPTQHDARDHSAVAGTIALSELGSRAHSELAGVGASDHHAKTTDDEVYGLLRMGLDADKPAAGTAGRFYWATDTKVLYRDTGTTWEEALRGETVSRLGQLSEKAHSSLTEKGTNTHTQIDSHIAAEPFDGHSNNPACRVYHSANQAIADATNTVLAFDSERFDTDDIHDTVTNNSRLTCKTAGKYRISAMLFWASNATGVRQVGLRMNGSTYIGAIRQGAHGNDAQCLSVTYDLAGNDYIEVVVYQNSGMDISVMAYANFSPEFMMERVA